MKLSKDVWNNRYLDNDIGWDISHASTPLKIFRPAKRQKYSKFLSTGCGNSYEAEYLYDMGFKNVFLIDWAQKH